jgi:ferrous iron transport protein B
MAEPKVKPEQPTSLLLIGNPNVGKSVIFGALTQTYVTVSNYPGTTVELIRGRAGQLPGQPEVVDSPGTNSLIPQSEDERVSRDLLLELPEATVIQVGDMKSLHRALYLTIQIAELGRSQILVLNLEDEARDLGIRVEANRLEQAIGVPVVPATAVTGQGIGEIRSRLIEAAPVRVLPHYPEAVTTAAAAIERLLPDSLGSARRGLAIMILAGDQSLDDWMTENLSPDDRETVARSRERLTRMIGKPVSAVIAEARHQLANELVSSSLHSSDSFQSPLRSRLGALAMHPIWGVPTLMLVLVVAYYMVGVLGAGTLVDLMESQLFGRLINPGAIWLTERLLPWQLARDFLVGEYGLITMGLTYAIAIVLPVVGTFFIFFGLLEDSGYLPRLAVMVNRLFRIMGLNGKAVLPMVLGLGCDTMATLTTRILPSRKERILVTLLLALGIPCSAQLGVILAMLSVMTLTGVVIWAAVVTAVLLAVGWAAARVLPGRSSSFLLEVPPLRLPKLSNIVVKTVARTEWYLKEAVPLFLLGTGLLFVMHATGLLPVIERWAEPLVVGMLGLPAQAADAFLIGFLRRDYGAAGLFMLQQKGLLDGVQVVVSLVVITLFVPCVAHFFMMVKERGVKAALAIVAFIVPFAFLVGGLLNWILHALNLQL